MVELGRDLARAGLRALVLAAAAAVLTAPGSAGAQMPGRTPGRGSGRPDTLRLDLGAAARLAAERSTSVELERLATAEADARVTEERASLLPRLSVDAVHGDRTFNTASFGLDFPSAPGEAPLFDPNGEVVGPVTTIDLRGRLAQTLFDWSALQKVRSARASVSAGRAAEEAAREGAAAGAAAAWVRAAGAARRLEAREEDVELAEELADVAREVLAAGAGVRLDVTRAESQLAAMRAQLVAARAEAGRSLLALKRALNVPMETPLALADTLAVPGGGPAGGVDAGALERLSARTGPGGGVGGPADAELAAVDTAVAGALARRGDVRALERRIDAARLEADAVEAERLPSVSVVAGDGITGADYGHLLNTYEWSLQVSVPVFDGFRRSARLDAQQARVSALEARRQELTEQVTFNVRDALLQLRSSRELVAASRARLGLAEEELAQARERFEAGVAGSADVFTASLRLNEARTAEVDALAAWEAARVTLAAAEGAVTEIR